MGKDTENGEVGEAIVLAKKRGKEWDMVVLAPNKKAADLAVRVFGRSVGAEVIERRPKIKGERETGSQHFMDSGRWGVSWQPTGPGGRNPLRPVD